MNARYAIVLLLATGAVALAAPVATAKDFGPGTLRICNAKRCVPISNRPVLKVLSAFYYTGRQPAAVPCVRLGALAFELRFSNGYVTGIVATRKLDRFLSYGVYLGRFAQGRWYRVQRGAARELRKLVAGLDPLRVTREALAKSR